MANIPVIRIGSTDYKIKDAEFRDNVILAQDTQPNVDTNRIWLRSSTEDHQVPTWEEFSDVKSALDFSIPLSNSIGTEYKHPIHFVIGYTLSSGKYKSSSNIRAATPSFYSVGAMLHFVSDSGTIDYEYDFYSDNNEDSFISASPRWMRTHKIMYPPANAKYFRLVIKRVDGGAFSGNVDNTISVYSITTSSLFASNEAKKETKYALTDFEYGNITPFTAGHAPIYTDNNGDYSSHFVRTVSNFRIHLLPRTTIRLSSYSDYYMYIGYQRTDNGAYEVTTRYTTDFVTRFEGDYYFLFGRNDSLDLNVVDFFQNVFKIVDDNGHVYDYDNLFLRGINHSGYSTTAPTNTLPAFKLSKVKGFNFVESDVRLTSDNIPVMIHNATIDETSDGHGNVADMTLAQLREFDFGSWKSAEYAGTKIPTFDQYIELCRNIQLYPYIELKEITFPDTVILDMINICKKYNMLNSVTWISYDMNILKQVLKYDKHARVGFVATADNLTTDNVMLVNGLKTGENRVFVDGPYGRIGDILGLLTEVGIEAEVYTLNDETYMKNTLSPRIIGVTSDVLNYPEIIKNRDLG